MSYFSRVCHYSQRTWDLRVFWEPLYWGADFEDLGTLQTVFPYLVCLKHLGARSCYLTFWHLPGTHIYAGIFPQINILWYQNIISNNFICFLEAREGEVNDFTKEGRNCPSDMSIQSQVTQRVTRNVDISTFLQAPKSGIHSLLSQDSSSASVEWKSVVWEEQEVSHVGVNLFLP